MFDDLKYILEKAEVSTQVKVALTVITKAISWFPWVFVGIGMLMKLDYFIYWLWFFMIMEGLLLIAMTYILVLMTKNSLEKGVRGKSSIKDVGVNKGIFAK